MPYTILERYKDEQRVAEVDKPCKVKFNFQWMDDKVTYEDKLGVQKTILAGSFLRKPEIAGMSLCIACNALVLYEKRGKVAWTDHIKTAKHKCKFSTWLTSQRLTTDHDNGDKDSIDNPLPSGPVVSQLDLSANLVPVVQESQELNHHPVSLCDRKADCEVSSISLVL